MNPRIRTIIKLVVLIGSALLLAILGSRNVHIIYSNTFLIVILLLSVAVVLIFRWLKPEARKNEPPRSR